MLKRPFPQTWRLALLDYITDSFDAASAAAASVSRTPQDAQHDEWLSAETAGAASSSSSKRKKKNKKQLSKHPPKRGKGKQGGKAAGFCTSVGELLPVVEVLLQWLSVDQQLLVLDSFSDFFLHCHYMTATKV